MKSLLLLALLASTTAAVAAPTSTQQDQPSKKELKQQRKLRRQNGPEVYKGSVAEQRRIVTDAAGAEKEDNDRMTRKEQRKAKKGE